MIISVESPAPDLAMEAPVPLKGLVDDLLMILTVMPD